jgi:hypothetical protein
MKTITQGALVALAVVLSTDLLFGQTNLNFNSVGVTSEGAILLSWNSTTNEVYEIDYANELVDTNTGSISWKVLYEEYPSHGTNTIWLDTGDYDNAAPPIPHPKKSPMRFYRIVLSGTNTGSNPTVTITSPTNNAVVRGDLTVTVNSTSTQLLMDTRLFVDGQEMPPSDDGTNFVINTCEWWSGPHTLFAVAKSQSSPEGAINDSSITYGHAVSPYVTVTFDNLISQYAFSEPFFEPDLGQTQRVSAAFAAGVDWTLEIQNASTNTVRFASGSGASMQFDWDGTGTNGVSLPAGVYTYLLTAQTNGQSYSQSSSAGGESSSSLSLGSSTSLAESSSEAWYPKSAEEAMMAGLTSYFVPAPPLPPIYTNGVLVSWKDMPPREVQIPLDVQEKFLQSLTLGGNSASLNNPKSDGPENYAGPSSQSTRGPVRPPIKPVRGKLGTFGIGYQSYAPGGYASHGPRTGWPFPLPTYVRLEGYPESTVYYIEPLSEYKYTARRFAWALQEAGWKAGFVKSDDQLSATDIKKPSLGGNSLFNTVDIGLLMTHGSYGTTAESDSVKYSYVILGNSTSGVTYLRLADFDFGSSATNGLKWMTIYACHILNSTAYTSMLNNGRLPINENLHLLSGSSTVCYAAQNMGNHYGHRLVGGWFWRMENVENAWFDAGRRAYQLYRLSGVNNTVTFGVVGWPACFNDTVLLYSDPDPQNGLLKIEQDVYTP